VVVIGYPSHSKCAFYLTIWATAKAVGPIVSGAINVRTNVKRNFAGQVSDTTYIISMVVMLSRSTNYPLPQSGEQGMVQSGILVIVDKQQSYDFASFLFQLLLCCFQSTW
jgi:hypothetical protein